MSWAPGNPVVLETERYQLRSLTPADSTERYLDWTADPEVMLPLNRQPRRLEREELARYIASFDNRTRFQLGVFCRHTGEHVGIFTVELDLPNLLARTNVLIGERAHWGVGIILETRAAILDFLFDTVGIEKVWGTPLARNFAAVYNYQAQGFRCEGVLKAHIRAQSGERLDQYLFALLNQEWRNRSRPQAS